MEICWVAQGWGQCFEFLLNLGVEVFHMYVRSRKVEKVFEMTLDDNLCYLDSVISPFTMVWPPSFPALTHEQVHQGQDEGPSKVTLALAVMKS